MNLDGEHTPGILETFETMPFGKPFLDGRLRFSHIFFANKYWKVRLPEVSRGCCFKGRDGSEMFRTVVFTVWGWMGWLLMPKEVKEIQRSSKSLHSREVFFNDVRSDCHSVSILGVVSIKTKSIKILMFNFRVWKLVRRLFLYVSVYNWNCRPIIITYS